MTRNKLLFFFSFVKQPKRTWLFFSFFCETTKENLVVVFFFFLAKSRYFFQIQLSFQYLKEINHKFLCKTICHIIVLENFMDIKRKNWNKFIIYWKFGQVKRVKKKHFKADIIIKLKIFISRQKLDFQQLTQSKIIAQNFCSPLTYRSWLVQRYR